MLVTNHGQQQSVQFEIDTDRCCGCKNCIRRCMEQVWAWDEEKKYAFPKYVDDCVLCYQCELECLNNVINITALNALQVDPLLYSAGLIDETGKERQEVK